jgi:hypothetical protein
MADILPTTVDPLGSNNDPFPSLARPAWRERLRQILQIVRQFLWGFFFFEMFHELQKEKARYSDAVNLVIVGELLGLPLMNSVIALRLLPYLLPELGPWKQRHLSEVDIVDEAPEIH